MPELVTVSSIEHHNDLMSYIQGLFEKGLYDEVMHAIGIHSILLKPQQTMIEQNRLYSFVLELIKKKIASRGQNAYSSWLASFPKIMASIAESREVVADEAAADALASRHMAFGHFKSLDEFYFWALDDRRLNLSQIMKYIEKTLSKQK